MSRVTMSVLHLITIYILSTSVLSVLCLQDNNIIYTMVVNDIPVALKDSDKYVESSNKVKLQFYYESLCPGSRDYYVDTLKPAIVKLNQYVDDLNIITYPYGHAKTIEEDGKITFKCQHGPAECYGNKLHACAIDQLNNITSAIMYNACLMNRTRANHGSDDAAADLCGNQLSVNTEPIKQCAKGERGSQLLKSYGIESKKKHLRYVPYVLINDKEPQQESDFWKDLCAAFTQQPPQCHEYLRVPPVQIRDI